MSREIAYDEVFDAQAHFRLLLDSMARPGKINHLSAREIHPPAGINRASVLTGFALLNADVNFHVAGAGSDECSRYLLLNTSSVPVNAAEADYIFLPGTAAPENTTGEEGLSLVASAKMGNLSYPEESATLIIDTVSLEEADDAPDSLLLILEGPGVEGERKIRVTGLSPRILEIVREKNLEFPLGVDMILTDKNDRILCIPRSNQFSWSTK